MNKRNETAKHVGLLMVWKIKRTKIYVAYFPRAFALDEELLRPFKPFADYFDGMLVATSIVRRRIVSKNDAGTEDIEQNVRRMIYVWVSLFTSHTCTFLRDALSYQTTLHSITCTVKFNFCWHAGFLAICQYPLCIELPIEQKNVTEWLGCRTQNQGAAIGHLQKPW